MIYTFLFKFLICICKVYSGFSNWLQWSTKSLSNVRICHSNYMPCSQKDRGIIIKRCDRNDWFKAGKSQVRMIAREVRINNFSFPKKNTIWIKFRPGKFIHCSLESTNNFIDKLCSHHYLVRKLISLVINARTQDLTVRK